MLFLCISADFGYNLAAVQVGECSIVAINFCFASVCFQLQQCLKSILVFILGSTIIIGKVALLGLVGSDQLYDFASIFLLFEDLQE